MSTLSETKMTPENGPSEMESSIPTIQFQVRAVSFREGNKWQLKDFFIFTPISGEILQFEGCIFFQMGWFNRHLDVNWY